MPHWGNCPSEQGRASYLRMVAETRNRLPARGGPTMFGYPARFVNGNMIAGLVRDRMVIRLGAEDRERLLNLP